MAIDLKKYKFTCMVMPGGIPGKTKGNNEANSRELIVSVCFNINRYCENFVKEENGIPHSESMIKANYLAFAKSLIKFQEPLKNLSFEFDIADALEKQPEQAKYPFEFFLQNQAQNKPDFKEYEITRMELWRKIFNLKENTGSTIQTLNSENFHPSCDVKQYRNIVPDKLFDDNDMVPLSFFSLNEKQTIARLKESTQEQEVLKRLRYINEFGNNRIKVSRSELDEFRRRIYDNKAVQSFLKSESDSTKEYYAEELLDPARSLYKLYMKSDSLEIDEIVHSFSKIADDPILARLMGLIIDYKLTFSEPVPVGGYFKIAVKSFQFYNGDEIGEEVLILRTPIKHITSKNKHAYIVHNQNIESRFFENTFLKKDGVVLQTVDTVSKILKQEDYRKRIKAGQSYSTSDMLDALTRGILFTHKNLNEIIKPVDIVSENKDGVIDTVITDPDKQLVVGEEHCTRGHRVAIKYNEHLYPLTTRKVKIEKAKSGKIIYLNENVASCIHFDAPTGYMENGDVKSATTNVLFEYTGELLKLKTAFAKAYNPKKMDHAAESIKNCDDDGLKKAESRWGLVVDFYSYPIRKAAKDSIAQYHFFYDIPGFFKKGYTPQLRFNNEYRFLLHQEYLNGWGLPFRNENKDDLQLTIEDFSDIYMSDSITFLSAENKKAPILVHKRPVDEELGNKLTEKPSLEHLVVRSNSGTDKKQSIDERHILPPKIDIETGFWHGLLSPSFLSPAQSFDLKTRSNCPFTDAEDRNSIENKKKKCPECGKMGYCGGTQLMKNYTSSFTPPFLTDPTVEGASIQLFYEWREDKKIAREGLPQKISYNGKRGIATKSYLLRANGSATESLMFKKTIGNSLEFRLKKGAQLYAEITNQLNEEGENHLKMGVWVRQFKSVFENHVHFASFYKDKKNLTTSEKSLENSVLNEILRLSNVPKIIRLTHAVKEPLITPKVLKLTSIPKDHKFIEHINDWLKEKEYQSYKLGVNIIANRIDKNNLNKSLLGSSYTQIDLIAHFERLDAIRKIEFLEDLIPTGALELWMRKEEYIDNPDQIVLPAKSETNHFPDQPVLCFTNPNNKFNFEYKIEFSNEIMNQLKSIKNIEDINDISDVFRSLITKLNLQYDFKTTKFEEREYYLKDISKFIGFFTDKKLNDNEDLKEIAKLEEFVLPKIKDVMSGLDKGSLLRFKVLVLNNSQPTKPNVAFAVTTIQEKRSSPSSKKTVSTQKGNIVTIYLKRGRLSSGKDERVGVIVDADSLYNKLYKDNELISKAGRDIVSDRYSNRSQYLQYGDIIVPENNEYKADFDNELGIYHFLPKFDIEKQMWKFEVELDIKTADGKQLHNPFINFSLVHFQPFSINYNDKTADATMLELKNDCRISDVENSTWCYLLPERKLSVHFDKPGFFEKYGNVNLTITFDHESLHHFQKGEDKWAIRSNFVVTVEGTNDGYIWYPVKSRISVKESEKDEVKWKFYHRLLNQDIIDRQENIASLSFEFETKQEPDNNKNNLKFDRFRVRFVEVEWFDEKELNEEFFENDPIDTENMRVRYVELFY